MCPACGQTISQEFEHVVLTCPKYADQQAALDPVLTAMQGMELDPEEKLNFILGGTTVDKGAEEPVAPPWTSAQWTGEGGETLGGMEAPVFVAVAKYLKK